MQRSVEPALLERWRGGEAGVVETGPARGAIEPLSHRAIAPSRHCSCNLTLSRRARAASGRLRA
jgi:hypothetical protein